MLVCTCVILLILLKCTEQCACSSTSLDPLVVPQRISVMSKWEVFFFLPVSLWLNTLTVITILCCHHFPCMAHNGNDVFTAAFLLLLLSLSLLLWHPCTVRETVQEAIVSIARVCACVRVWSVCIVAVFVLRLYIHSRVYVCILACLPSRDNCKWMAEFLYLFLPEASFHFGHPGVSPQPFSQTKRSWFLGRRPCTDKKWMPWC